MQHCLGVILKKYGNISEAEDYCRTAVEQGLDETREMLAGSSSGTVDM